MNEDYSIENVGIPSGLGKELDEYDSLTAHARGAYVSNIILNKTSNQATNQNVSTSPDGDKNTVTSSNNRASLTPTHRSFDRT